MIIQLTQQVLGSATVHFLSLNQPASINPIPICFDDENMLIPHYNHLTLVKHSKPSQNFTIFLRGVNHQNIGISFLLYKD